MKIHKEGFISIALTVLLVLAIAIPATLFLSTPSFLLYFIYAFCLFILLFVIYFFRIPNRNMMIEQHKVIAPADGKIVVIEKTNVEEYVDQEMMQISIFMSPVNVHVNRFPVSGMIKYFKYHPGKFLFAYNPKSSLLNERTTTVVENDYGLFLFRQIAGGFARRIVSYVAKGEKAVQTNEFGFIKFGSRVDIFIPAHAKVKVKLGETTKGGQSVLAEF